MLKRFAGNGGAKAKGLFGIRSFRCTNSVAYSYRSHDTDACNRGFEQGRQLNRGMVRSLKIKSEQD